MSDKTTPLPIANGNSNMSFVANEGEEVKSDRPLVADRIAEMRAKIEAGGDPLSVETVAPNDALVDEDAPPADDAVAEPVEEPVEEDEEEEAEEDAEEEDDEGAEDAEAETVVLRGRNGEQLEVTVTDPAIAEALRINANDGMRRDEFNKQLAALQRDRAELDLIGNELEADPVSFLAERTAPALRVDVVKHLLATMTADEFAEATADLPEWESDERERELTGLKLEKERKDRRETAQRDAAARAEGRRNAEEIVHTVSGLLPEGTDDRTTHRFQSLALEEIQEYARAHNLKTLDPSKVPTILARAGILEMFKIQPPKQTSGKPATPPATAEAVEATPDKATAAQAGAERVKKRAAVRKAATAVAPSGTGAVVTRVQPPKGQTGEERIKWLRENRAGALGR